MIRRYQDMQIGHVFEDDGSHPAVLARFAVRVDGAVPVVESEVPDSVKEAFEAASLKSKRGKKKEGSDGEDRVVIESEGVGVGESGGVDSAEEVEASDS